MRKILYLLFATVVLFNCSSDDSTSNSSDFFLNINVIGDTFSTGNEVSVSLPIDNCDDDYSLTVQSLGQIENSEILLTVFLTHAEEAINFNENAVSSDRVLAQVNLDCHEDLDFIVDFFYEPFGDMEIDSSANNFNTISSIILLDENNQEKRYAISGSFGITFTDGNGTNIPMIGDYRAEILVLNF